MHRRSSPLVLGIACGLIALAGCNPKPKTVGSKDATLRAQAKRNQAACASQVAYDQLKGIVFDQAIAEHDGDRSGLDTLADYSLARMEQPVVQAHDASLDITKCEGHLVLDLPPGAEKGFGGDRQLAADIAYTAQASADGRGYVYRLDGAEPIVSRLKDFALPGSVYRAPAAVDQPGDELARVDEPMPAPAPSRSVRVQGSEPRLAGGTESGRPSPPPPPPARAMARSEPVGPEIDGYRGDRTSYADGPDAGSESAVRGFYAALGAGRGSAASQFVVPEKRSSRTYSAEAISRFYGNLREPLRLSDVRQISPTAFRVRYHYSPGRTRCDGVAVVQTTLRDGRAFIRSIRALSGC